MFFGCDFEQISVGDAFRTRGRTVTENDVGLFAGLSGDHHPLHTDAVFAAAHPFGERVAHGMLVASIAAGLVPFDPERVLMLRRLRDVVFKRPVRLGDTVTARVTVKTLYPQRAHVILATAFEVNGKTVLDGEALVMVPRRPA